MFASCHYCTPKGVSARKAVCAYNFVSAINPFVIWWQVLGTLFQNQNIQPVISNSKPSPFNPFHLCLKQVLGGVGVGAVLHQNTWCTITLLPKTCYMAYTSRTLAQWLSHLLLASFSSHRLSKARLYQRYWSQHRLIYKQNASHKSSASCHRNYHPGCDKTQIVIAARHEFNCTRFPTVQLVLGRVIGCLESCVRGQMTIHEF